MITKGTDLSAFNVRMTAPSDGSTKTVTTTDSKRLWALEDESGRKVLAKYAEFRRVGDVSTRIDSFEGFVSTQEIAAESETDSIGLSGSILKLPFSPPAWLPSLLKKIGLNPAWMALILWALIALMILFLLFKFGVIKFKRR